MMKATARPITLYLDRKSMNSAHRPVGSGVGGAGLGASNSLIFLSSSNMASSLGILITILWDASSCLLNFARANT